MSVKFETVMDDKGGRLVKAFLASHPCVAGLGGTQEKAMRHLGKQIDEMRLEFARSCMAMPQDADKIPG